VKKNALLTPRMAGILERMGRARRAPLHTLSVEEARLFYEQGAEVLDLPRAPLGRVEELSLPLAPGVHVAARLYATDAARRPLMLYFHGGGFAIGSLETHDSLCRQLALHSASAVLAVDYRLAPEHPFPCAIDDAWAALAWALRHAGRLGLDADQVTVCGDSAGAALAAVSALHARDQGWPLRGQILITPHTAAQGDTPSRRKFAEGFLLDESTISWFFDHSLPADQRHDWRFAPLEASDLDGVAPACLVLAECDPLVDEGVAYADRLRMAGVPVDLELVRGVTHEFIKMGRLLPEALAAQRHICRVVRAWTRADL
jgi:acetyl esterase